MIDASHPLLLGSASPRRRQLLETLGLPLRIATGNVDESTREAEGVEEYLVRVTAAKLRAAAALPAARGAGAILVADTAVVIDGRLLAKPIDDAEATAMLQRLAGRVHEVKTRFALAGPEGDPPASLHAETVTTRVEFRSLDPIEIEGYVATGEGRDKAGAYAIQGIGGFAVSRIDGSYSNVVGLPVCEVVVALRSAGLLARFPIPGAVPK